MPPTLDIPVTITDFRAWEDGDKIEFAFTLPNLTTENLPLTSVRSIELRIGESEPQSKRIALAVGKPGPMTGEIPARDWIGKSTVLDVRATGPKGKPSAWSNPVSLVVIQPLATPSTPKAQNVVQGVELTWTGMGPRYRIFRAEGDGQPQKLADSDGPPYLDATTAFGTHYRYLIQAIAAENQWSVVSDAAEIIPIELSWTRNTETDFRGYNIFRSVDNASFEKIASFVEKPTFSDSKVEAGKKYRYTVSAVDLTGNESIQSAPVEATAQ
jgi:hypothetical protein